jgi:hypothetical protein
MPNTYVALYSANLSGLSSANFTNIPQNYTDLILVFSGQDSATSLSGFSIGINSTFSGGLYSNTILEGNGSSPYSNRSTSQNGIGISVSGGTNLSGNAIVNFQNYSNTTTFKTILTRYNASNAAVGARVDLFRSNSAITRLDFFPYTANWATGTTLSVYGVANADQGTAKATGGVITEDETYWYHTFGATGAFIPKQSLSADILVIAGGGGTAVVAGGGGGAGGLLYSASSSLSSGVSYTCAVGAGGAGSGSDQRSGATNGVNSTFSGSGFSTITAIGGGFGIGFPSPETPVTAGSGGSGGGSSGPGGGTPGTGTAGPPRQGFNGATGNPTAGVGNGGGGGGAGVAGTGGISLVPGNGGNGVSTYSSWGIATRVGQNVGGTYWFAGGGGGAGYTTSNTNSVGGFGGGGAGISGTNGANGIAGMVNTGGGGGGSGGFSTAVGAAGGSGVIIVRYAK